MKKVLIIEDHPHVRELLATLLTAFGYQVITAVDGEEGLQKVTVEMPDLVLVDMQLPVLDGYEVVRRLCQVSVGPRLPIVGVSAYALTEEKQRALDAGVDAYLTKPIDSRLLRETVERLLQPTGQSS